MAEPLILAYGRGELPEFPAAADTIVDIVPVDHVVAAIVAVLAHPPEIGAAGVLPRLVGLSQPARPSATSTTTCAPTSTSTPSSPASAAPSGCPTGASPARRRSSGCSAPASAPTRSPTTSSATRPRGDRTRDLARKLDQQGRRLEFLRRYLDLYREYAQAELRYDDTTHARAVPVALEPTTRCGSPSTPPSSTGRSTSRTSTAPRSPRRSASSTSAGWRSKRPDRGSRSPRSRPSARDRGVLRHGRDAAVLQRHRGVPVAAAAGAVRRRPAGPAGPGRGQGAVDGAGRAARPQRLPAHRLPRVRRRPARPSSRRSSTGT